MNNQEHGGFADRNAAIMPTIYLMTYDVAAAMRQIAVETSPSPHSEMETIYGRPFEALPTKEDCEIRAAELKAKGERPSIIERPV